MKRREFITLLGGAAAGWPLTAGAQQPAGAMRRVGVLMPYANSDGETNLHLAAFRDRLRQLGWTENKNVAIDYRWIGGDFSRTRELAKQLVDIKPDVIIDRSTPLTAALLKETQTIPIVFLVVSDPVGEGFAANLARPGGNATGFTNVEASLGGKWIELIKEIAPSATRVCILFDPKVSAGSGSFYLGTAEKAAGTTGMTLLPTPINDRAGIDQAVDAFAREPNGALLTLPDTTTTFNRAAIFAAAARHRLPAVYAFRYFAAEGGLASYGVDVAEQFRQAAGYVDRILRGEKPAELPVQAPTKFEFVVNLKTAKAQGLQIAPTLLTRADEVIE
jgi:putative tryptophan/tyrosine transport system substrate-binding protein